jgi:hypothetical protein
MKASSRDFAPHSTSPLLLLFGDEGTHIKTHTQVGDLMRNVAAM